MAQTQAGGRQPGRGGSLDEPADKQLNITETDKAAFEQLCTVYGWTQGRMFREILGTFIAHQQREAEAEAAASGE